MICYYLILTSYWLSVNSMIKVSRLIVIATLIITGYQLIQLKDLPHTKLEDVANDPFVLIEASSSQMDHSKIWMFAIKTEQREKKLAYFKINQKYRNVVDILKKYHLISDEDFLPKSKIKSIFLTKRRKWQFTINFLVSGNQRQLFDCYKMLSKLGIKKEIDPPSSLIAGQNIKIIQAYNNAKEALRKALKNYPRMKIVEVTKVEIQGMKDQQMKSTQHLSDYQEEDEKKSHEIMSVEEKSAMQNDIRLKVVFRIGENQEQQSSDFQSESSQELNSQESESFE